MFRRGNDGLTEPLVSLGFLLFKMFLCVYVCMPMLCLCSYPKSSPSWPFCFKNHPFKPWNMNYDQACSQTLITNPNSTSHLYQTHSNSPHPLKHLTSSCHLKSASKPSFVKSQYQNSLQPSNLSRRPTNSSHMINITCSKPCLASYLPNSQSHPWKPC